MLNLSLHEAVLVHQSKLLQLAVDLHLSDDHVSLRLLSIDFNQVVQQGLPRLVDKTRLLSVRWTAGCIDYKETFT